MHWHFVSHALSAHQTSTHFHNLQDLALYMCGWQHLIHMLSMAEPVSHRLDLHVGGKYRLSKKIGSVSFGVSIIHLFFKIVLIKHLCLFRWHLPWDQYHLGGRSGNQVRVCQGQTSPARVQIKGLQNFGCRCRCSVHPMVQYGMWLQHYGAWPSWALLWGPVQLLSLQI